MRNPISLTFTILVIALSGCHKPRPKTPSHPPNPPILPAKSPAQTEEGKSSDPRLADLEDQMGAVYREKSNLSFEAKLTRWTKENGLLTNYLVKVEMSPGTTEIEVFEEAQLILWMTRIIQPSEISTTEKEYSSMGAYAFKTDKCLFGTLTYPWSGPGPIPASDPPYTNRIRDGTYLGATETESQICHRVRYEHGDGEVSEEYYINAETFLLVRWDSFHYESPPTADGPWMIVTRTYRQPLEPTLLSAKTETQTGELP